MLDHPGIVPVFELGELGPTFYIASAYIAGPTLGEWAADRGTPIRPDVAARLMAAVADAVHHAHTRGVLHRDLKPSNILLEPKVGTEERGDETVPVPRVAHFGLPRLVVPGRHTTPTASARVGTALPLRPSSSPAISTPRLHGPTSSPWA